MTTIWMSKYINVAQSYNKVVSIDIKSVPTHTSAVQTKIWSLFFSLLQYFVRGMAGRDGLGGGRGGPPVPQTGVHHGAPAMGRGVPPRYGGHGADGGAPLQVSNACNFDDDTYNNNV